MKCIKCGREIPDGDLFCLECSLTPAQQRVTGEAKPRWSFGTGRWR